VANGPRRGHRGHHRRRRGELVGTRRGAQGGDAQRDHALGIGTQGAPRRTRARCSAASFASQATVTGCSQQAAAQSSQRSNTTEIVIGGALYRINENRQSDTYHRKAYPSCVRSRGYTG
jgi:hypothetical protein